MRKNLRARDNFFSQNPCLSLLLCDCTLASEKMIKSQGYEKLFTEVNGLGPPDPVVLKSILAMATHGQVLMIKLCIDN